MKIICEPGHAPEGHLLNKLTKGAELCVQKEGLNPDEIEISLTFITGKEMKELNKLYRGEDKVTDVLSFPQYDDLSELSCEGEILLGDVVICTEQVLLQADELGHSNERELVYLFIHSVCHLLGYDHMEKEEQEEMRRREKEIMEAIEVES